MEIQASEDNRYWAIVHPKNDRILSKVEKLLLLTNHPWVSGWEPLLNTYLSKPIFKSETFVHKIIFKTRYCQYIFLKNEKLKMRIKCIIYLFIYFWNLNVEETFSENSRYAILYSCFWNSIIVYYNSNVKRFFSLRGNQNLNLSLN